MKDDNVRKWQAGADMPVQQLQTNTRVMSCRKLLQQEFVYCNSTFHVNTLIAMKLLLFT